jgi:phospholipid-binding lipoprotein MlaA
MKGFHGALLVLILWVVPVIVHAEAPVPPEQENVSPEKPASPEKENLLAEKTADTAGVSSAPREEETEPEEAVEEETIADPIEPWNRIIFTFNDRFYFWFFKPAAKGYNAVFPEPVRLSVRNFFDNLAMPVRFVNSFLQGKLESAGIELARFGINSTIGFAGLFDVAKDSLKLERQKKDTGMTLGYYGIGTGPYIIWPFLGPSSLRDSVGLVGDIFLSPVNYVTPWEDAFALDATEYFNENALHVGEYEDLIESAVEPYVALKNAYTQHRRSLIRK